MTTLTTDVATTDQGQLQYKVKDLSLAESGRKEIRLAEHEMPGLMALRDEVRRRAAAQGVPDRRLLHMTVQTAVLIETLTALGRRRPVGSLQHLLHPGPRGRGRGGRAAGTVGTPELRAAPVFAWKGETLEEYWWCTEQVLTLAGRQRART
ncbi:MAG: hypothetical protein KatS3mg103_1156 [Phycisphaerales bacterium]|nr:MAG: hypothetical protein KatS3mg103_1156 [Phycisphaerales bacterium]